MRKLPFGKVLWSRESEHDFTGLNGPAGRLGTIHPHAEKRTFPGEKEDFGFSIVGHVAPDPQTGSLISGDFQCAPTVHHVEQISGAGRTRRINPYFVSGIEGRDTLIPLILIDDRESDHDLTRGIINVPFVISKLINLTIPGVHPLIPGVLEDRVAGIHAQVKHTRITVRQQRAVRSR